MTNSGINKSKVHWVHACSMLGTEAQVSLREPTLCFFVLFFVLLVLKWLLHLPGRKEKQAEGKKVEGQKARGTFCKKLS